MSPRRLALLASLLLGSCDPDQPLPDAIACETDDDCEDDSSFCNGTPTCVKHVSMTAHGPWRIHICEQRLNPRCPGSCDEVADVCLCEEPDADGDGHAAIECGGDDCDDTDDKRNPALPEVCDADDLDEDCDPSTFGDRDADGDGFPDAQCCNDGPAGTVCGSDCDDRRASTHPTAVEACDTIDNDCDGSVDEGVLVSGYEDEDGDGYGTGEAMSYCAGTASYALIAGDCDDTLSQVHPGSFRCVDGSDIEFCASASWVPASCPGLGLCVVQPDGTGVCLPGSGSGSACSDGVDNDGDGLSDFPDDPGCDSAEDDSERGGPGSNYTCDNGIDDDMDGATDYPDDVDCSGPTDTEI